MAHISASVKLKTNASKIVLEKDGTEIMEDEVLILLKGETLMLLGPNENWKGEGETE